MSNGKNRLEKNMLAVRQYSTDPNVITVYTTSWQKFHEFEFEASTFGLTPNVGASLLNMKLKCQSRNRRTF